MSEKTANHEWGELEEFDLIKFAVRREYITAVECSFDTSEHRADVNLQASDGCPDDLRYKIISFLEDYVESSVPDAFMFTGTFGVDEGGVFLHPERVSTPAIEDHFNEDKPGWYTGLGALIVHKADYPEEWRHLCQACEPALDQEKETTLALTVTEGECTFTPNNTNVKLNWLNVFTQEESTYKIEHQEDGETGIEVEFTPQLAEKIPNIYQALQNDLCCLESYFVHRDERDWQGTYCWCLGDYESLYECWTTEKMYVE